MTKKEKSKFNAWLYEFKNGAAIYVVIAILVTVAIATIIYKNFDEAKTLLENPNPKAEIVKKIPF